MTEQSQTNQQGSNQSSASSAQRFLRPSRSPRWLGKPPRQKIGLALSGGAARGIAHIGVLEVLSENGIEIDCIAGTSAGAIAGGLFAAGVKPEEMLELISRLNWFDITSFTLPKLGLLNLNKIDKWLEESLEGCPNRIEDLSIPFAAVAADIISGELVAIAEGPLALALRASASVPGIMEPCKMQDYLLVDGGIINNLPVSVARRLGADYIIAVDLLPPGVVGGRQPKNMLDLMVTSFYMLMRSTHNDGGKADCIIQPDIGDISVIDLDQAKELRAAGREAALKMMPKIRRGLAMDAPDVGADADTDAPDA